MQAYVNTRDMKISIIDGSNYFKGLLLLIGKDRKLTESEITLMKRIGKLLGFEKEFCENAIHEILENKYILDVPPEFSSKELAEKFVRDGLAVAASDNELHQIEAEWLRSVAEKNGLTQQWFETQKARVAGGGDLNVPLEVDKLTVQY